MNKQNKIRIRNALLGAAVADSASMGFHWLYDQERILAIEPVTPEFHNQSPADYEGVAGYFAHGRKCTGEFSQYGEQMMTMLRSLADSGGVFDKSVYENIFREFFGYGGAYVGYIDHPTRETLDNLTLAENDAVSRAKALTFNGTDALKHRLITKVLASAKQAKGDALRVKVEEAVRTTDDDDYLVAHAFKMIEEFEEMNGYHGARDEQLPAVSKLPPLVAAHIDDNNLLAVVDSAVRVTNDADLAVSVAGATALMLQSCYRHGDLEEAIAAGLATGDSSVEDLIECGFESISETTPAVTKKYGMACELAYGLPSIVHNLSVSGSYSEAVRQNIYSGGDSCGRSILIGAMMGACHGVGGDTGIPEAWIDKLVQKQHLTELLEIY